MHDSPRESGEVTVSLLPAATVVPLSSLLGMVVPHAQHEGVSSSHFCPCYGRRWI